MFSPAPTGFNRVLLWFPTTHTWLSLFSFGLVFLSLVFLPTIEDLARIGGKHNWLDAAADSSIAISRLLALPPFKPTHEPTHIFPSSPPLCQPYANCMQNMASVTCVWRGVCVRSCLLLSRLTGGHFFVPSLSAAAEELPLDRFRNWDHRALMNIHVWSFFVCLFLIMLFWFCTETHKKTRSNSSFAIAFGWNSSWGS